MAFLELDSVDRKAAVYHIRFLFRSASLFISLSRGTAKLDSKACVLLASHFRRIRRERHGDQAPRDVRGSHIDLSSCPSALCGDRKVACSGEGQG